MVYTSTIDIFKIQKRSAECKFSVPLNFLKLVLTVFAWTVLSLEETARISRFIKPVYCTYIPWEFVTRFSWCSSLSYHDDDASVWRELPKILECPFIGTPFHMIGPIHNSMQTFTLDFSQLLVLVP